MLPEQYQIPPDIYLIITITYFSQNLVNQAMYTLASYIITSFWVIFLLSKQDTIFIRFLVAGGKSTKKLTIHTNTVRNIAKWRVVHRSESKEESLICSGIREVLDRVYLKIFIESDWIWRINKKLVPCTVSEVFATWTRWWPIIYIQQRL